MNTEGYSYHSQKCKISRLNRYLLKQGLIPFIAGFALFSFILLMDRIFQLFDMLIGKEVSISTILEIFMYSLPFIIALTVPMGVLVSTIATYGRMSDDNEILALRSLGINPVNLMRPFILAAFFITISMSFFNLYILPESNFRLKKLLIDVSRTRPTLHLYQGRFNKVSRGYTLFADSIDHSTSRLSGVKVFEDVSGESPRTITAESARMEVIRDSLILYLSMGEMHRFSPGRPSEYRVMEFDEYVLSIPVGGRRRGAVRRSEREMNLEQLLENTRKSTSKRRKWRYLLEIHKKFSIPFASIVFVLIGVPLGIQLRKGGMGNGITLSFFLFMLYYVLLVGGEELCERGSVIPSISMWFPNIFLGIIGIYLFYRIIYEK